MMPETQLLDIIYYASNIGYFRKNQKVTRYFVKIGDSLYSELDDINSLKDLGIKFRDFYRKNEPAVKLQNATPRILEQKIFRSLTEQEEKIFLQGLKSNNSKRHEPSSQSLN